ncbi:MAG: tetratricopeptide repeat protein [Vicinamibacterales bacterium]
MSARRSSPAPAPPAAAPSTLSWTALTTVAATALVVRLVHLWQMTATPFATTLFGDAKGYDQWARRLAGGDWIGSDVFYQAPLYPYFLGGIYATLGADPVTARIVQALVGAGSAALLAAAAARLFDRRTGLVAGLMLGLYAPAIFLDGLLQKSVLDVFFVALLIYALARAISGDAARRRWWTLIGVGAGALALTRENALVLVVVLVGWIAAGASGYAARRGRAAAAFALGVALVLAPVAVRNYAVSGDVYLTTSQFGPNFYIGNNAAADGSYQSLRFGRGSPEFERTDATELAELAAGRTLTPGEVSAYWRDRALAFITGQPGAWLRLMGRKALLLVNANEAVDTESQESYAEWSWPLRVLGWLTHVGVLLPLAIVGAWATWADRRRLAVFGWMALAFALSTLAFFVFARYRYPLVPLLMLGAAPGVLAIPRLAREWRTRSGAVALVLALVAAAAAQAPLLSPSRSRAITETNLGTALYEAGKHDDAVAAYRRAIAAQPDYVPAFNNLGVTLRAAGRTDEALAAYRDGLALRDDYPDLHYNLANALIALGRSAEATEHLSRAAAANGDSAGVHNNLGTALADQGRFVEAVAEFERAVALEPASSKAHRNLGNALIEIGRQQDAFAHLTQAVSLAPEDAEAHYDLGAWLLSQDRNAEAIEAFTAAIRLRPAYAEAHNNLGIAIGSTGDLTRAIAQFEEALRLQPGFADAAKNLEIARRAARVK